MKNFLFLLLLLNYSFAAGYQNLVSGYIFENSSVTHPKIDHVAHVKNYAINLQYTKMHPLYYAKASIVIHPNQYMSKGYSEGYRYTSRFSMKKVELNWGAKYLFSKTLYFVPSIGVNYLLSSQNFSTSDKFINEGKERDAASFPLDIFIGYQYGRKSDLIIGINVEDDVTNLRNSDDNDYSITWQHSFNRNPLMRLEYRKTTSFPTNEIKIVHERFLVGAGFNF
jgi:hypothetical protein